jgi:hypothetical protein
MLDQVQTKAANSAMEDVCVQNLREDALCSPGKNGDSTRSLSQAQSSDASKAALVDPRVGPFSKSADDVRPLPDDPLPHLEVNHGSIANYDGDPSHESKTQHAVAATAFSDLGKEMWHNWTPGHFPGGGATYDLGCAASVSQILNDCGAAKLVRPEDDNCDYLQEDLLKQGWTYSVVPQPGDVWIGRGGQSEAHTGIVGENYKLDNNHYWNGKFGEDSADHTKDWTNSIYLQPPDKTAVAGNALISEPPVNYDDTTGIDRRRFYIPQPNNYSCAPTSLTEALFDFNASGGGTGLHFDGATFADPNARKAMRLAVERAEEEPQKDFGSIDEEAMYARKFGLSTKLHFDPDSGVSITPANVNQAMGELDAALAAGHGVIVNVPHHFVYCAGKTADGQYIMGDPADPNTALWNSWRMTNEMDHQYDPFNRNSQWTPTGFVEVWNPDKPAHDHIVSLGYPRLQSPHQTSGESPEGQYQSQRKP